MHTPHRSFPLGAALLLLGSLAAQANVVIDYAEVRAVEAYSQATMDTLAQASFYFEHASVGGNMIAGLEALHASNPTFYRLTTASEDGTPPSTITAGTVYEYNRGNPGWSAKISGFASDITGGWGGQTTFALNKFCYIDPAVDWATYRDSMVGLEAANPGTTFVYMTIPLTTEIGGQNIARNVFNATLRAWAAANNKTLFDIADIEAHDAAGALQTFTVDGISYELLASDWSADGGHLNAAGQVLVASGFYALAAETAAIPEPATYTLMLGLSSLLFIIVRQRYRRWHK